MPRHRPKSTVALRLAVVALAGLCLGTPSPSDFGIPLPLLPFADDADIRALRCPLRFTGSLPTELAAAGCLLSPVPLPLSQPIRSVLVRDQHEHDGMYGVREDVALVTAAYQFTGIVAGLTQLELTVYDGESRMRMRRQRVVPSPEGPVLCIETVFECGPGLFSVLDLGRRPYRPLTRTRRIEAFIIARASWQPEGGGDLLESGPRLLRTPEHDAACPSRGYAPFVAPTSASTGAVEDRRSVQGDARGTGRAPEGVCVDTATPSET